MSDHQEISQQQLGLISRKVWTSYGIANNFMLFLLPLEQIELQKLNLFWYNIAVGRSQPIFRNFRIKYFGWRW